MNPPKKIPEEQRESSPRASQKENTEGCFRTSCYVQFAFLCCSECIYYRVPMPRTEPARSFRTRVRSMAKLRMRLLIPAQTISDLFLYLFIFSCWKWVEQCGKEKAWIHTSSHDWLAHGPRLSGSLWPLFLFHGSDPNLEQWTYSVYMSIFAPVKCHYPRRQWLPRFENESFKSIKLLWEWTGQDYLLTNEPKTWQNNTINHVHCNVLCNSYIIYTLSDFLNRIL